MKLLIIVNVIVNKASPALWALAMYVPLHRCNNAGESLQTLLMMMLLNSVHSSHSKGIEVSTDGKLSDGMLKV